MKKYKCALVFGTFDCLHFGHIRLLKRAKGIAKTVVACTESNIIIKQGKSRKAFTTERQRVEDLEGIKYVDAVFVRSNQFTRDIIVEMVEPDVLILGSDWRNKDWEGRKYGIPIVYFPRTKEISSTLIRKKLWPGNI